MADSPLVVVTINQGDPQIMATLAEIHAAVTDLQATAQHVEDGVDRLIAEVQGLKDQLAAGTGVTQADLDGLMASLQTVKQPLTEALEKEALP